jgi:hypothetical protein
MQSLESVLAEQGLNLPGWSLDQAMAISADGTTIVGLGHAPSGATEAWIAVIPEPQAARMLALGVPLLFAHLRRKRMAKTESLRARIPASPA